jgi:hypothetical protein
VLTVVAVLGLAACGSDSKNPPAATNPAPVGTEVMTDSSEAMTDGTAAMTDNTDAMMNESTSTTGG